MTTFTFNQITTLSIRYNCSWSLGLLSRVPEDFHQSPLERHMADKDPFHGAFDIQNYSNGNDACSHDDLVQRAFKGDLRIHVLDHKHLLEPLAHPRLRLEMVDCLQVWILLNHLS